MRPLTEAVADSELPAVVLRSTVCIAVNKLLSLEETTDQSGSERRKLEILGGASAAVRGWRLRVLTPRKSTSQANTATSPNVVASSGGLLAGLLRGGEQPRPTHASNQGAPPRQGSEDSRSWHWLL